MPKYRITITDAAILAARTSIEAANTEDAEKEALRLAESGDLDFMIDSTSQDFEVDVKEIR